MRILIVRLGAIGDIIHTLPALSAIKSALPGSTIYWAVEKKSAEILRGNPLIEDLIEVDTRSLKGGRRIEDIFLDLSRQIRSIRRHRYDLAIDMQGLIKSAVLAKASGAERVAGYDRTGMREPAARFLYSERFAVGQQMHVIRKSMALAGAAIGIDLVDSPIDLPISTSESDRIEAASMISDLGDRIALLNPAGGWVTKLWPAENFGRLADRLRDELGLEPIVVAGPTERDLAEKVAAATRNGVRIEYPGLKAFYELARLSQVYIGGDTGPTHLAIAAGTPIVGIFGPTEWWRNGSLEPDDICVERTDINCRIDCHRRTCSNWICMDIPVATVFDAVVKRLAASAGKSTDAEIRL